MAFVLETGIGLRNSNSYASIAFADSYLSDRARITENSWDTQTDAVKEAKLIQATQYIDVTFGSRFQGSKLTYHTGVYAVASVGLVGAQSNTETFTVAGITYTVVDTLSDFIPNQVLSNADPLIFATRLRDAILNVSEALGVTHSQYTVANPSVNVSVENATLTLTSRMKGSSGNDLSLNSSNGANTVQTFVNGSDEGYQAREFPRSNVIVDGRYVLGVPTSLKEATVEYAVHALSNSLELTPAVDASGRPLTKLRQKAGPVETEKEFSTNSEGVSTFKPLPSADNLLKPYIHGGIGVVTGGGVLRA